MKICSRVTLILACVILWQARETARLTAAPDYPFDPKLVRHISPIEWRNIILCGEIRNDPAKLRTGNPLARPTQAVSETGRLSLV